MTHNINFANKKAFKFIRLLKNWISFRLFPAQQSQVFFRSRGIHFGVSATVPLIYLKYALFPEQQSSFYNERSNFIRIHALYYYLNKCFNTTSLSDAVQYIQRGQIYWNIFERHYLTADNDFKAKYLL